MLMDKGNFLPHFYFLSFFFFILFNFTKHVQEFPAGVTIPPWPQLGAMTIMGKVEDEKILLSSYGYAKYQPPHIILILRSTTRFQ